MVLAVWAAASAADVGYQLERVRPLPLGPSFTDADSEGPRREGCEAASTVKRSLASASDAGVSLGTLGGARAAVHLEGPGGSGRYWTITVGVASDAGVIGACLHTSTIGHRWASAAHLWKWEPLQNDRLVVWTSVFLSDEPAGPSVLLPKVFQLEGPRLVLDVAATAQEVERFAAAYEKTNDATLREGARRFRAWVASTSTTEVRDGGGDAKSK